MASHDVVVVGAGTAGLTAAHRLAAAGVRVRVLEAEPGPGGRMSTLPVGHAAAVQRYRDRLPAASPVLLAGDYLGFPWCDSAAFNGRWAADRLVTRSG